MNIGGFYWHKVEGKRLYVYSYTKKIKLDFTIDLWFQVLIWKHIEFFLDIFDTPQVAGTHTLYIPAAWTLAVSFYWQPHIWNCDTEEPASWNLGTTQWKRFVSSQGHNINKETKQTCASAAVDSTLWTFERLPTVWQRESAASKLHAREKNESRSWIQLTPVGQDEGAQWPKPVQPLGTKTQNPPHGTATRTLRTLQLIPEI